MTRPIEACQANEVPGQQRPHRVVDNLTRFANLIAAVLCIGVFLLFSSGMVVPLHEGGWIEADASMPLTALCLLVNLSLGLVIWLVTRRSTRSFKVLQYTGLAIGSLSVLGLLVICLLIY